MTNARHRPTWRAFSTLEAIEGRGADVHLGFERAEPLAARKAAKGHPIWRLFKKELRLHQLAWIVAGLYAAGYVAAVVSKRGSATLDDIITIITIIYTGVVAILIGSLASAEERQFGTHDVQLLLPVAASRQWMVKAGTALGLSGLLAIALPIALAVVLPPGRLPPFGRRGIVQPQMIITIATFTTIALYVSSLSSSGLRALMISIPAVFAAFLFMINVAMPVSFSIFRAIYHPGVSRLHFHPSVVSDRVFYPVAFAALLLLLLRFAFTHQRWASPGLLLIGRHVVLIAGAIVACFALAGVLGVR